VTITFVLSLLALLLRLGCIGLEHSRLVLQKIATLGRDLVRVEAILPCGFSQIVGGKRFQHDLELKRRCMSFQFLGHEIYLPLGFQSISHLPWFPLWG